MDTSVSAAQAQQRRSPDSVTFGDPGADQGDDAPLVSPRASFALGLLLIATGIFSLYALIALWPAVEAATSEVNGAPGPPVTVTFVGIDWTPSHEVALLMLVTFASALGSSLHASISFTDYVGNRNLRRSWIWWYVLRSFVGVALAVLFYFALRGGLFSANTTTDVINPFGIAALAGLVGLFSKQATDKLREIFDTMFRTAPGQGDDQRGDGIVNPRPVVGGAVPSRVDAGTAAIDIRLAGEGFIPSSLVRVSRSLDDRGPFLPREARVISPSEVMVRLVGEDLETAGTLYLTVLNPPPGGGVSRAAEVEIGSAPAAVAAEAEPNGAGS